MIMELSNLLHNIRNHVLVCLMASVSLLYLSNIDFYAFAALLTENVALFIKQVVLLCKQNCDS